MSTTDDTSSSDTPPAEAVADDATATRPRRRAASRPAGPPAGGEAATTAATARPARSRMKAVDPTESEPTTAKRSRARKSAPAAEPVPDAATEADADEPASPPAKRTRARKSAPAAEPTQEPALRRRRKATTPAFSADEVAAVTEAGGEDTAPESAGEPVALMFQAPSPSPARRRPARKAAVVDEPADDEPEQGADEDVDHDADDVADAEDTAGTDDAEQPARRRRRRGGRGRRRRSTGDDGDPASTAEDADAGETSEAGDGGEAAASTDAEAAEEGEDGGGSRRRRRRRRKGSDDARTGDDPPNTVTKVREGKKRDEITSVKGSTRLEAKKQRRREGREAGRRRPSILTEAEFLARREAVERVMVVRQVGDRTQIAVLEDGILVEHYVNRSSGASMIGNVYLGRVQNVLPSMEAAFVDIGRGRNAVLYAGEVNWDAAGLDGQPRRIELVLKSGDSVLVQVSKDPIGHKGARLTSQISLPGRFLVYVPHGEMTGISRKLPDTERTRLKSILRKVVPGDAGVIVRTAAEGASEDELTRDVERLSAQWAQIEAAGGSASAPALLHGEPDLAIKVVRDIFNEDFHKLVVSGDGAWGTVHSYVEGVAPELLERVERWTGTDEVFHAYRVDEQLTKALDRKVWLPSGGSLVIDRTEAMTVVDVNTGKFTGSGGNLEETVTRNNLEAAEEIVRQLRLRDIGGIIVVDFIDMVLESNRDLVLRRLLECLGRDRTKHQVAEVTSLGLVQMTRKRIGQGLLEVFSESCDQCHGRGVVVHAEPVDSAPRGTGDAGTAAARSASASAGAAKVHAAARRAKAKAETAESDDSSEATGSSEPTESSEPAVPDPEEPAAGVSEGGLATTPRPRGTRRRASRSAGPAAVEVPVAEVTPAV